MSGSIPHQSYRNAGLNPVRRWSVLLGGILLLGFCLTEHRTQAGFQYPGNSGSTPNPGSPTYNMFIKAAQDLAKVNKAAGEGIEEMVKKGRVNTGSGPRTQTAAAETIADGKAGTDGDGINVSKGWVDNPYYNPNDANTWSGSCWNQLLGVLAHEWVHANTDNGGRPPTAGMDPLTDYRWESPAYKKEMEVLAALGEPDGFYFVPLPPGVQGPPTPVKTRREFLKQRLAEKIKRAMEQLRTWLNDHFRTHLPAHIGADRIFSVPFFDGVRFQQITWGVDGKKLWGMVPGLTPYGENYDLPLDRVTELRGIPEAPLGTDHAVVLIAGPSGPDGVILALETNKDKVIGQKAHITIPNCMPQSMVYNPADSSLFVLDLRGQQVLALIDSNGDRVPDAVLPQAFATVLDWPQISNARQIDLLPGTPGLAVSPVGFLPYDMVPLATPLVLLQDTDGDFRADVIQGSSHGLHAQIPPAILNRPNAFEQNCDVFGTAGALVTIGRCDVNGVPLGEVLGFAPIPPDNRVSVELSRPLMEGEYIRCYDPPNDPWNESEVYQVPPEGTNRAPSPRSNGSQVLTQTSPAGAMVTLDASASFDPDGDPVTIEWQELTDSYSNPLPLGSGSALNVPMSTGMHLVRLRVGDGQGTSDEYLSVGVAPSSLELNGNRFVAQVEWRTLAGGHGWGQAVPLTPDSGYFWFFGPDNVELALKVLDGRPVNGHFWVLYGSLTDVEFDLTITDTETEEARTYHNPQGSQAGRNDILAFPLSGSATIPATLPSELARELASWEALTKTLNGSRLDASIQLETGDQYLYLNQNRFRVELAWSTPNGGSGIGHAVPVTSDTGYFWFFGSTNVELVVKVLDGRGVNGHFWVFYGALTDVQYTITITDMVTGTVKTYQGIQGTQTSGHDINAFTGP